MGDEWLNRVSKQALRAGHKLNIDEQQGLGRVGRVGGTNVIKHKATVPMGDAELGNVTYSGSMLEDSEVPAP
eukprot:9993768-Prorocentrum_lima.AAC.1